MIGVLEPDRNIVRLPDFGIINPPAVISALGLAFERAQHLQPADRLIALIGGRIEVVDQGDRKSVV